ncbi:putative choline dehydrogenase [Podospora didyma]|uniref:Choline dehydrogenase n=1 Tax=Podospora didyma TaxID=330526 RepID=A0AAE0K103_9PEZI|nr:putative choline dehydrogenase [Podospora didyma]
MSSTTLPSVTADGFAKTQFDFLIVGGGTAGLAVAARLSENPRFTVGVLEAGSSGFEDAAIDLPGLAGQALGTERDWGFETVRQPGLGGRTVPWARGKVLGGSSALNFMTWNRASRHDYDDWEELGNLGWGWDSLLPFFKKSESFFEPSSDAQTAARVASHTGLVGHDGPVKVSYPNEYSASHGVWHKTLESVGVKTNDSHLGGTNTGCWTSACSVDPLTANRSYGATAYYLPNASRPNLVVLTDAEVLEILLAQGEDSSGWEAKGVRFAHRGAEFSAFASREIVLSAGSVQSPQLLELSGVGGAAVLTAAGVSVKVDNPNVGENLQDHLTTTSVFEADPSLPNPDDLKTPEGLAAAQEEYIKSRTGPLTVLPVSMAYVPISHVMSQETTDTILYSSPAAALASSPDDPASQRDALLRRRFSPKAKDVGHVEYVFDLGNWSPCFPPAPVEGKKYASMLQIMQYPFSKGSVHITSGPSKGLAINPQYYAGAHGHLDLEIALHCHRFAEKICAAEPLASILRGQVHPLPSDSKDDEYLRAWLKKNLVTDWHPVGTCAMGGKAGARGGVVDERLRVYGVRGLRVADASIMPLQISAHLQATVYAIAEKAASMILEDVGVDI